MQLYTHYKNGATYEVITDQALFESSMERAVVYRCRKTGQVWIRSFEDFHGLVDQVKGVDVVYVPRFQAFPPAASSSWPTRTCSFATNYGRCTRGGPRCWVRGPTGRATRLR